MMKQTITRRVRLNLKNIGVLAAVIIMAGGVAFALLQSQAKLTGNSISTTTTGLYISQNDSNYGPTTTGYSFTGIIPGDQASQTEHFLLKNTGSSALTLKASVANSPSNPSNADLSKIKVILTPYSTTTFMPATPQTFSLQSLIDAHASGGLAITYPDKLTVGMKEQFNIQIAMDADAVSGSGALLSSLDLAFNGVATN